jgi:hypothetical protein
LKKKKQKFKGKRCPEQSRGAVFPGTPMAENLNRGTCCVLCGDAGGAVFSLGFFKIERLFMPREKKALDQSSNSTIFPAESRPERLPNLRKLVAGLGV